MVNKSNIPIRNSIGFNLIRGVFSIYIIIAIIVTLIHMLTEYFNVKQMIENDLALYQTTYENQLADALWDFEEDRVATISEGIIKLPAVTALKILDTNNTPIISLINNDKKNVIEHKFSIEYNRENESSIVGYAIFYSDRDTIFNKLSTGFMLIIINSVIKTLALWGIFLWLVKPMLIIPLEELTASVRNITVEDLDKITLPNSTSVKNELFVLSESFNEMKVRLQQSLLSVQSSSQALSASNNYLEQLLKSAQRMMLTENKQVLLECYTQYLFHGIEKLGNCQVNFIYSNYISADNKLFISLDYQVNRQHIEGYNPIEILLLNEEKLTTLPLIHQGIEQGTPKKISIINKEFVVPFIWKSKLLAIMTVKLSNSVVFSEADNSYLTTLNQLLTLTIKQIDIKQQLENKVKIRTAEIEKISNYKTKFLANMSHEIRTPMNGVLGSLQLLEQSAIDYESKELVDTALSSSNTLLTIINDILDFSKIEEGKLTVESKSFNCNLLLNELINELQSSAKKQQTQLSLHLCENFYDLWIGDIVRVKQILLNIISNAIKFTQNGQVNVNVTMTSQGISIQVVDTGIGMSEQALKSIFGRFEQADSSTTREYGGTGLGTNIAQSLAELMNGNITVQSKLGEGSVFIISLPLIQAKKQQQLLKNKALSAPKLPKLNILLAEDNLINITIFNKLMSPTSAKITIAKNGEECVSLFNKIKPDLIFMDIQMPVMDGLTACKIIKEQSNIPIIALTANVMSKDITRYKEIGFDAVLSKPIELKKLYETCENYA